MLDIKVDVSRVAAAFPLQNALGYGRDGRVVTLLDHLQGLCELFVVLSYFWWPDNARSVRKVSSPSSE